MTDQSSLAAKAAKFRELHRGTELLVLPNAWDVASAKLVEAAGFPAIATSSAGVANTLGYPDGQRISRAEMLAAVERIARTTDLPVSADLQAGYGSGRANAAELARELIAAGAVGLNLEDATGNPARPFKEIAHQVEEIRAIREEGAKARVPLVINARTDIYLEGKGDPAGWFEETLKRCLAYRDAGADCIFVPGLKDASTIGALVKEIRAPFNVLAGPGVPPLSELKRLGVKRVSLGSGLMRACMGYLRKCLGQVREGASFETLLEGAVSYAELNELMTRRTASAAG